MGQPLIGDEEEGDSGAGRQEEDEGDDDLLGQRGAGVVAVLRLSSGLQKIRGCSLMTSLVSDVVILSESAFYIIGLFRKTSF